MNRKRAEYLTPLLERLAEKSKREGQRWFFLQRGWVRTYRSDFNSPDREHQRRADAADAKRARRIARNKRIAGEVV